MGAFRFETIAPENSRGGGLSDLRSEILDRERNTAYAKGFKDGVNVTKDALEVENNRLMSGINEALSDINITTEQASAAVMRTLSPLIETVISHLAPTVLEQRLIEAAEEALVAIHENIKVETVTIEVASQHAVSIGEVCARNGFDVRIKESPKLHDLEVRVHWADGFDHIDMEAARSQIIEKLNNFVACLDEETDGRERESSAG